MKPQEPAAEMWAHHHARFLHIISSQISDLATAEDILHSAYIKALGHCRRSALPDLWLAAESNDCRRRDELQFRIRDLKFPAVAEYKAMSADKDRARAATQIIFLDTFLFALKFDGL
ncbi:MAG: hypothetical protein ABI072_03055 [Edaphobacter sp.]